MTGDGVYVFEGEFPAPETVDEMRAAWRLVDAAWAATIDRAGRLPETALHERVDGEWSFVETLRHVVFAIDSWFRRPIRHDPQPFWAGGLPHSSYAGDCAALGIDRDARPTVDDAVAVFTERSAELHDLLAGLTAADLVRVGSPNPVDCPDDEEFTVQRCLGVIFEEAWLHRGYAARDLSVLEVRPR